MSPTVVAFACPGCIQGAGGNLEAGLLWGLILMMVIPFAVIGIIGGGIMRAKRRELTDEVERFLESEREDRHLVD